jgi:CubicO group peptidase (beta-lactamase class C family)
MKLCDEGKISVTDPVIKYIPEYNNNNKSQTKLLNLLLHNAGLDPDAPNVETQSKDQIINWIYNCKLAYSIGTKFIYSDISFILLGLLCIIVGIIVERVSGQKL